MDLQGNFVWAKRYGGPVILEESMRAVPLSDNSIAIMTYMRSSTTTFEAAGVLRIDTDGNMRSWYNVDDMFRVHHLEVRVEMDPVGCWAPELWSSDD